jgi:hypothetical protein
LPSAVLRTIARNSQLVLKVTITTTTTRTPPPPRVLPPETPETPETPEKPEKRPREKLAKRPRERLAKGALVAVDGSAEDSSTVQDGPALSCFDHPSLAAPSTKILWESFGHVNKERVECCLDGVPNIIVIFSWLIFLPFFVRSFKAFDDHLLCF